MSAKCCFVAWMAATAWAWGEGPEKGPAAPAADVREAEMAAAALAVENEELRAEVARLREREAQLTVSLAAALAELDLERNRPRGDEAETGGAVRESVEVGEWSVVDVNRALNMVVFDAGSARGVKPGMRFKVVRDRKALATVRAIDVREKISGALVSDAEGAAYPEKGDRVILAR